MQCRKICPVIQENAPISVLASYAARAVGEDILRMGSSGGVFPLLARYVAGRGGVVYGAAYHSGDYSVKHQAACGSDDLPALYGSKYVQSDIGDAFRKALEDLAAGRLVLFCGTPCQVAGLNRLARNNRENLILVDFICHGVPSPAVLKKYLHNLENKYNSNITKVRFRSKYWGWQLYSLEVDFANGKKLISPVRDDVYLQGFIRNLYLRKSCHACRFRGRDSGADITIGDYWESGGSFPQWNDDKGISAVMVHTENGAGLLEKITDMTKESTELGSIGAGNPALLHREPEHNNRNRFFRKFIETGDIELLIREMLRLSICQRAYNKFKRLVRSCR